jgi:hypothetical protein
MGGIGGQGGMNSSAGGSAGGGGGYYGGGGGGQYSSAGGGGSSYIGGVQNGVTIAGDAEMPTPAGGTTIGNNGDGYVRILEVSSPEWTIRYTPTTPTT